jgi:glycosyltransferase involved in cell wall biosynthesis
MNILLVNKFYYLRGGAERSFFETKRLLESRGHRVIPFAMQDERNEPTAYARYFVDNVEFNRNHSLWEKVAIVPRVVYFRQARRRLERLLRRERVDLAHLHNIAHQISPSILHSLEKFRIPVVQTIHDYKLICPTYTMLVGGQVCERCHGGRYYRAALQRCNKGSFSASLLNVVEMYAHQALGLYRDGIDLFIAPSRFLRRKLIEDGLRSVPILHLPNFIDTQDYTPRYGGQDYCVYFGRLSVEKGVMTLIRSMRGLSGLRLLVVGEGLQRKVLEELIRKENLSNVELLGPLHGDDLKRVVQDSLFVVLPSQCYENCPFSILESFALGKPVIGSNIGGIPELITPGKDGLLFEPGSEEDLKAKMRYLANNRKEVVRMGMNARARIEQKHSIEAHYRDLMTTYHRVLGSRKLAESSGKGKPHARD